MLLFPITICREINGLEFLKILRAWGDLTPFILFSDAETIEELARAAALYGSVGLISKNRDLGSRSTIW